MNKLITMAIAGAVGLAGGLAVLHSPAVAGEEAAELERITVIAPRVTHHETRIGETLIVEKDAEVDLSDLDLNRTSDYFTLERRVKAAATRICEELREDYPRGSPSTRVCIQRAFDDAMDSVKEITGIGAGS